MAMKDIRRNVMIQSMTNALEIQTATGNPVAFNTQIAKSLNSVVIPLSYIQEGTGDPSPTNVRPISGVSSLFCVHAKKNMAKIRGYSATNINYPSAGNMTNNYGTSINTNQPGDSVVITQSTSSTNYSKSNYRNGYFAVLFEPYCVVNNTRCDISFRVTNITGNPLDATLYDWHIIRAAGGSEWEPDEVKDDVVIFKNVLYKEMTPAARYSWEIRNCAMSCTVSDFMITPANTNDGVYEPYDGAKLDVTFPALGKNLFDKSTGIELLEKNILVARNDGYGVPIHMKAGVTYYVYVNAETNPNEISLRVPYQATTIYVKYTSNTGYLEYTPEEDIDVAINAYWINGRPEDATDLMIETGSKTSYEPYNNSVYGGSLDLVSGVLTLNWKLFEAKSLAWETTSQSSNGVFICRDIGAIRDSSKKLNIVCNQYKTINQDISISSMDDLSIKGNESEKTRVYIRNSNYTDADSFAATLDDVYFACELATPITVQLTPAQASAFVGDNTVWTNTAENLTVTYKNKKSQGT